MTQDVFISYSSKDGAAGQAVCRHLEERGLRCWIAPRDIAPGVGWARSIVRAIGQSRTMVLIFSANANDSPQIEREVERAVNKGVPIIPLRIEELAPSEALEYFLSSPHWLDAFKPPLAQHLDRLTVAIQALLGAEPITPTPAEADAESALNELVPSPAEADLESVFEETVTATSPPERQRPAAKGIDVLFGGVEGTERNLIVISALTTVATVVTLLSAGLVSLRGLF